ncbi:Ankyrin repeat-containing domain protein [Rhypophila sp. PSN 637]
MNVLSAQPNHHNQANHAKQDISGPAPDLFLGDGLNSLLGKTVLHLAAEYGHAHVVQTLLARRMDVNLRDDMGDTALHLAARHGHHSVIQVLVSSNATLDIRNSSGRTALQLSVIKGDIETVQLLLDQGATVI